jgi:rhodanese-related sulfurtransferase
MRSAMGNGEERSGDQRSGGNTTGADSDSVSPEQARELIASGEARAFDLRDEEQWAEDRVPGCVRVDEDELDQALERLGDGQKAMVVCEDGERSAEVAQQLRERDVDAISIEGGMEAWRSDKQPLQPSEDPDDDVRV